MTKLAAGWLLLFPLHFHLMLQGASSSAQGSPDSVSAAPGQIMPPPPNYHFPDGISYVYAVEWHMFTAGTATVRMEPAELHRKVTAVGDSVGVVNAFYGVHDRLEAHFDPKTFCSVSIVKHVEEGSHKRDTQIHFDYARGKSILDERNLKTGETKHTESDIPGCVTDVVSGFYYLASLPLRMGSVYTFTVNDGGRTADASARVEAREQIKTPAGTFPTLRVVAEAISGNLKGKGKVWAWFSDDASRTPVQMRAKLTFGTLLFRLQRIERQ